VPLAGLDVRRCDACALWKNGLRILRRFSSDFRRQPKVAFFGLRVRKHRHLGKTRLSSPEWSGAADVVGMEVLIKNDVHFSSRPLAFTGGGCPPSFLAIASPPHPCRRSPASTRISCLPVLTRKPVSATSSMCGSSCSAFAQHHPSSPSVPLSQCGSNAAVPSNRAVTSKVAELSAGRSPAPDHDAGVRHPELRSDRRQSWRALPEERDEAHDCLLSTFPLLTTGALIALPPLMVIIPLVLPMYCSIYLHN